MSEPKLCTTSGESPEVVRQRQQQEGNTGQHSSYIVLCEEERQKGFVRPYRDAYVHLACGSVTTMNRSISETYARDPSFYGSTFCVRCGAHFPLRHHETGAHNFEWTKDRQPVGS